MRNCNQKRERYWEVIENSTQLRDYLLLVQTYELCIVVAIQLLSSAIFFLFSNVLQQFCLTHCRRISTTHEITNESIRMLVSYCYLHDITTILVP